MRKQAFQMYGLFERNPEGMAGQMVRFGEIFFQAVSSAFSCPAALDSLSGWWLTSEKDQSSSIGMMIIPNIWKNKTCSKPPTSYGCFVTLFQHIPTFVTLHQQCFARFLCTILWNTFRAITVGLCPRKWQLELGNDDLAWLTIKVTMTISIKLSAQLSFAHLNVKY